MKNLLFVIKNSLEDEKKVSLYWIGTNVYTRREEKISLR